MPNFTFGDNILENVNSYKYLGIIMHENGKYIQTINDRTMKTNRAIHMLKQVLGYTNNATVKLTLSLFDKNKYNPYYSMAVLFGGRLIITGIS